MTPLDHILTNQNISIEETSFYYERINILSLINGFDIGSVILIVLARPSQNLFLVPVVLDLCALHNFDGEYVCKDDDKNES